MPLPEKHIYVKTILEIVSPVEVEKESHVLVVVHIYGSTSKLLKYDTQTVKISVGLDD